MLLIPSIYHVWPRAPASKAKLWRYTCFTLQNRKPPSVEMEISDSIWFTVELNEIRPDLGATLPEVAFATPKPRCPAPKPFQPPAPVD